MATITERVADDVIHQELRAIGENSAADGQVLPKYLDISRDPPPPSVEELTQTSPGERAEGHERSESGSSEHVAQGSAQSNNPENETPSEESASKLKETEMERSETFRQRIAGKRTVKEDAHADAKKERIECTDLSLECPLPEASQSASIDTELRLPTARKKTRLMTAKLTRARDRASMSCRLFLGRPPCRKPAVLKWTKESSKRNSASVKEMNRCVPTASTAGGPG